MAWPRPSPISKPPARPPASVTPNGSRCCSSAKPRCTTTSGSPPACATPSCASRRASRTSTTGPRAVLTALFAKLVEGRWIDDHANLLICGPAGVGKSWLASALGHKACRDNRSVLYQRVPRLFDDLTLARGDGRHPRLLRALGRVDLLILDDWGLAPLDAGARHDLLEILEDRYGRRSTLVTSQLPVDTWHVLIGDPTYADAVLDRLVHNAHRLDLTGESLRRTPSSARKT